MEVRDLLEEVTSRYDKAVAIEIDLYDQSLVVIARDDVGYPEYTIKHFDHFSDVKLLAPNSDEDIWE